MKRIVAVLVLFSLLVIVPSVEAQGDCCLAFTLNPNNGDLQVSALAGSWLGGSVDITINGQFFAQVSMPDMESGDVVTLAVIPNADQVHTWSVSGTYSFNWHSGGEFEVPEPVTYHEDYTPLQPISTDDTPPLQSEPQVTYVPVETVPQLSAFWQRLWDFLND